jgi:hypothetical protein
MMLSGVPLNRRTVYTGPATFPFGSHAAPPTRRVEVRRVPACPIGLRRLDASSGAIMTRPRPARVAQV